MGAPHHHRREPHIDRDESHEDDVLVGLRASHKELPCRLLYDAHGAELFDRICDLNDYYLTRAELGLLERNLPTIATEVGPGARVIEPGSGAGRKTRMLLGSLASPSSYVPIDVSREQLEVNARALRAEFAGLEVQPVHGDYVQPLVLPQPGAATGRTLVFFPGSTIGNFEPAAAETFLARFGELAGPGAMLVVGADANADPVSLLRAYNDSEGVTAAFDLNVLAHLNRTRGANFDLDGFIHRATWDSSRSRIEMQLVSNRAQAVQVDGETFELERDEVIVTEHCYKHRPEVLGGLLANAGWQVGQVFVDPEARMRLWVASRVR